VSGRTVPGTEGMLGMFANTVCLRSQVTPDVGFADFLRTTGRTAEDAFAHQDFPFSEVVSLAGGARDYRRSPLFDALIALHSSRYLYVEFAGQRVALRFEPTGQSVFDLDMQIYELDGSLQVAWRYGSHILRRNTVESWAKKFLSLLDAVLADPTLQLADLTNPDTAPDFDFDL
jgi:non-ribosomal peptide synthetase component F